MLNSDIQNIIAKLEKSLDSKRFGHTMGVAYTAACIAMRYDYDMNKEEVEKYNPGTILPVIIFRKNDKEIRLVGEKTKEEIIEVIEELK